MYIEINGIQLYYEEFGDGSPIILIHGNGEDHKIFIKLIDKLKAKFKIYALDSRGHGKSSKVSELSYKDIADDIIGFVKEKKLVRPMLYGFSDGGIVGLLIAIKEPTLFTKMIISGANTTPHGLKVVMYNICRIKYLFTKNIYLKLMINEPDINEAELSKIMIPILLTFGSNDLIRKKEINKLKNAIKTSTLIIFKQQTHSSYVVNSDYLSDIFVNYFKEKGEKN